MKATHIVQALLLFLIAGTLTAQQGINYKAIINNANGDALANTTVTVLFTILENGTTIVFQETHSSTTDANGIIIVNIGEGTAISGDFNTIDWGSNPHFLKTEIDTGEGLTDMGSTEFKPVPYALFAKNAEMLESRVLDLESQVEDLMNYIVDDDGDGYVLIQPDCNDSDPSIYPGATEFCDGIDNDCNGLVDDQCISQIDLEELELFLNTSYESFDLDEIINTDPDLFDYFENHLNCTSMAPDDSWPETGWFSTRTNCTIYDCSFFQESNYNSGYGVRKNASLAMEEVIVANIQENSGTDFTFNLVISPNGQLNCLDIPFAVYVEFDNGCLGEVNVRTYGNVTINTIDIDIRIIIDFAAQNISLASSEVTFSSFYVSFTQMNQYLEQHAASVYDLLSSFIKVYFENKVVTELLLEIQQAIADEYFN